MATFTKNLRETLIAISREMFPHKFLEKGFYGKVVDSIWKGVEEGQRKQLEAGVRLLEKKYESPFVEVDSTCLGATNSPVSIMSACDEHMSHSCTISYKNENFARVLPTYPHSLLLRKIVLKVPSEPEHPWLPN